MGTLIGQVLVEPANATIGQSIHVQVCDVKGQPLKDSTISVNIMGVPGASRYLQYATPGTRKLLVRATRGTQVDTSEISIEVAASKDAAFAPVLQAARIPGQPYAATFTLGIPARLRPAMARAVAKGSPTPAAQASAAGESSAEELHQQVAKSLAAAPAAQVTHITPQTTKTPTRTVTHSATIGPIKISAEAPAAQYKWEFGDGQSATTQSPTVTHDYFAKIQPGDVTHTFDVSCTHLSDKSTVQQTLTVQSAYGLCRQLGVIVPPIANETYATFGSVGFSATMVVNNLESSPITLQQMACAAWSQDPSVAAQAPRFVALKVPVVLAPASATGVGVYVPLSQIQQSGGIAPSNVAGFTIYYSGAMGQGSNSVPVHFSCAFRISLADRRHDAFLRPSTAGAAWDTSTVLQAVATVAAHPKTGVSKSGAQAFDPATNTVAIPLSGTTRTLAVPVQLRTAVQAGMKALASKAPVSHR